MVCRSREKRRDKQTNKLEGSIISYILPPFVALESLLKKIRLLTFDRKFLAIIVICFMFLSTMALSLEVAAKDDSDGGNGNGNGGGNGGGSSGGSGGSSGGDAGGSGGSNAGGNGNGNGGGSGSSNAGGNGNGNGGGNGGGSGSSNAGGNGNGNSNGNPGGFGGGNENGNGQNTPSPGNNGNPGGNGNGLNLDLLQGTKEISPSSITQNNDGTYSAAYSGSSGENKKINFAISFSTPNGNQPIRIDDTLNVKSNIKNVNFTDVGFAVDADFEIEQADVCFDTDEKLKEGIEDEIFVCQWNFETEQCDDQWTEVNNYHKSNKTCTTVSELSALVLGQRSFEPKESNIIEKGMELVTGGATVDIVRYNHKSSNSIVLIIILSLILSAFVVANPHSGFANPFSGQSRTPKYADKDLNRINKRIRKLNAKLNRLK